LKKELPGWVIPVLVVVAIAALGGIWMMAGRGGMTPAEQKMAEEQSDVQRQLGEAYGRGQSAPGSEAEARRQYEAQQSGGN
jgi:hypothetical protein